MRVRAAQNLLLFFRKGYMQIPASGIKSEYNNKRWIKYSPSCLERDSRYDKWETNRRIFIHSLIHCISSFRCFRGCISCTIYPWLLFVKGSGNLCCWITSKNAKHICLSKKLQNCIWTCIFCTINGNIRSAFILLCSSTIVTFYNFFLQLWHAWCKISTLIFPSRVSGRGYGIGPVCVCLSVRYSLLSRANWGENIYLETRALIQFMTLRVQQVIKLHFTSWYNQKPPYTTPIS